MQIKNDGPYERFNRCGASGLSDADLIAVILRTGIKEHNAVDLACRILCKYDDDTPSLHNLFEITKEDLLSIPGIGEVKAVKLLCLKELSLRMSQLKEAPLLQMSEPETIFNYYRPRFLHEDKEQLFLLSLDNHLRLIREDVLSTGTQDFAVFSVRDTFNLAVKAHARFILLMHNHPGGDPTPSNDDITSTQRTEAAGKMMGIELLDHVIIGNTYFSFKERGLLSK